MAAADEPVVDSHEFQSFLTSHRAQLETYSVPRHYWKSLFVKLKNEIYDAGEFFTMVEDGDNRYKSMVTHEDGVKYLDPNSIFLIDHAWTYQLNYARKHLLEVPGLAQRMVLLMGCAKEEAEKANTDDNANNKGVPSDEVVDKILERMWCFNQTYQIRMMAYTNGQVLQMDAQAEEQVPLWYIMDEFGCSIQHSDEPTFNLKPFYFVPLQMSFNIMWPTRDVDCGEETTRDFIHGVSDPIVRAARLLPWIPDGLDLILKSKHQPVDLDTKDYMKETLPEESEMKELTFPSDYVFKVFTDCAQVKETLKHPHFVLVENEEEADILWLGKHHRDFKSLVEKKQFINQFPNERILTCKDLLARACRCDGSDTPGEEDPEAGELGPSWLATTFDLQTELPHFIRHYMKREERGLDNHWICKPWNLGRSLDIHITSDLNYITRLVETGPKIACKYLENPVLFHREEVGLVKFDVRYVVLLTSVNPLVLHVQRVFWLRFANKPFSLDNLGDYDKHFTVMNYTDSQLKQIHHYDFIPMFEKQYPDHKWEDQEAKLFKVIKEVFIAASSRKPPEGVGAFPQSRAFYALDMMLKWDVNDPKVMRPILLEVNFIPDCERANKYYPEFFTHVFSQLFLGDDNGFALADISNV